MKNKLLLVDDNTDICSFYVSVLKGEYDVKTAHQAATALALLEEFSPDVVLLDIDLPQESGLDICGKMRGMTKDKPYVAIIFLTGNSSTDIMLKGLEIGADDYLAKPCSIAELKARIKTNLRIKHITDELTHSKKLLQEENKKLEQMTITDELTKLHTMGFFTSRLNDEYSRACRYNYELTIIMVDLDHFKRVNDTCNHIMGSHVLARVGDMIKKQLRQEDIAARYGGDEFVLMLPHTDKEGAMSLAKRIAKSIGDATFTLDKFRVNITVSMGIYTFDGSTQNRKTYSDDLLKKADELLYLAKKRGRNLLLNSAN